MMGSDGDRITSWAAADSEATAHRQQQSIVFCSKGSSNVSNNFLKEIDANLMKTQGSARDNQNDGSRGELIIEITFRVDVIMFNSNTYLMFDRIIHQCGGYAHNRWRVDVTQRCIMVHLVAFVHSLSYK